MRQIGSAIRGRLSLSLAADFADEAERSLPAAHLPATALGVWLPEPTRAHYPELKPCHSQP
jgi:hypothetical protein